MVDHQALIKRLCNEKYGDASAIYWAGSVVTGNYTSRSVLDLVIIFESIPNAYREAFVFEDWKIDAFIHDFETLTYFFEDIDLKSGIPALPQMIVSGKLITPSSSISKEIEHLAAKIIKQGPPHWDKEKIDNARFFITDLLDDIISAQNRSEQIASTSKLLRTTHNFIQIQFQSY